MVPLALLLGALVGAEEGSAPIPAPSTTCAGSAVVVGWCLADAPLLPGDFGRQFLGTFGEGLQNLTDAECCAKCVANKACVAWNTNAAQGECHLRAGVGTPNGADPPMTPPSSVHRCWLR